MWATSREMVVFNSSFAGFPDYTLFFKVSYTKKYLVLRWIEVVEGAAMPVWSTFCKEHDTLLGAATLN